MLGMPLVFSLTACSSARVKIPSFLSPTPFDCDRIAARRICESQREPEKFVVFVDWLDLRDLLVRPE